MVQVIISVHQVLSLLTLVTELQFRFLVYRHDYRAFNIIIINHFTLFLDAFIAALRLIVSVKNSNFQQDQVETARYQTLCSLQLKQQMTKNDDTRSLPWIMLLASNCALGTLFYGYSLSYLNVSLKEVDSLFHLEKEVQVMHGIMQASLPIGALFGAFLSSVMLTIVSRRQALIITDFIGIAGTLIQLHPNLQLLIFARIIIGITTGLNSALVPLYINAFTPKQYQGNTGVFPQLSINIGILIAFILGLNPERDFSLIFMMPLFPCILRIIILLTFFKYDPPSYYLSQPQTTYMRMMAIDSLKTIYKPECTSRIYEEAIKTQKPESNQNYSDLFGKRYLKYLIIACTLQLLSQFCGINAVIFYSSQIFSQITNNNQSLVNILNLVIPITGILCAILSGSMINRIGRQQNRKNILLFGDFVCFISLAALGISNKVLQSHFSETAEQYLLASMIVYIFGFGISLGPVIMIILKLYIPEIVPEKGVSLAGVSNWIGAVTITYFFPLMVEYLEIWRCFMIFSFICGLGLFFINYFVVEEERESSNESNNYSMVAGDEKNLVEDNELVD